LRLIFSLFQILTKDSVTVFVNAIMYYKVRDPESAVTNVDDYSGSARLLAATTLRNVLGTKNLGDILSERESIAHDLHELLLEATEPWGVTVERVEVKDVRVPEQLMRAMAAEAEAARNARAKVIAAEGEHKASRSLKHAAEIIMENPAALQVGSAFQKNSAFPNFQLRYLQTLNSISAENNSTIIFPVPVDILSSLMGQGNKKVGGAV
jgi:erythrocyte band 7 integral membrane protein